MRRYLNFIILAAILIALSALVYFVHYAIFHDVHHIFIYMVGDLAFLPLEVFLVVIVIERVLARREKQAIMQKLNMVVGAFFSEVGTELLQRLLSCFGKSKDICQHLDIKQDWTHADFKKAISFAGAIDDEPDFSRLDLNGLKKFLVQKRQFLLASSCSSRRWYTLFTISSSKMSTTSLFTWLATWLSCPLRYFW